ncbi:Protein of unknown function [Aquimarina amphilecti]|uniref:DUF3822 domain-containing protein n=1 Tax=Aquimarina amphilecti TaxID=1038014 RepID=A0A1H7G523_AQUAM|nr:DUF3822 family protein [Aquimarina amphilecti]SEK30815.1 Protein of unknown function [Aquimarina amphilecti]
MTQIQNRSNTTGNTKYTLSIQVSLNGLSFCAVNSENEIITLEQDNFGIRLSPEQVLNKIKYILDHNTHLKYDFETVEVIYQNDLYTSVPKALFDPELLKDYLKYNIKVLENDFIAYDELNQHEIVIVYIPYTNITNFFFETFGSFTYKHCSTILIDNILSREKNSENTKVYAHMNSTSFDLVVVTKGKLVLSNSYIHETDEDFLYYVMFAAEQLRLNPEELQLVFLGDISKDSSYYTIAHKYIRNVSFGNRNNSVQLPETTTPIAEHEHFVLLSHF